MESRAAHLLRRVRRRQSLAAFGRSFGHVLLALLVAYLVALCAARPLGLLPEWDHRWAFALPLLAAGIAAVLARRATTRDAARAVDASLGADDLFLTRASLEPRSGAFSGIVEQDAEARALAAAPARIVPFDWQAPAARVAAATALLVAALLWAPAGDPFGLKAERAHRTRQAERLAELEKATSERLAALRAEDPTAQLSEGVQKAVEELQKTFGEMRPDAPEQNQARLDAQRESLGEKWRASRESARREGSPGVPMQSFGDAEKRRQWETSLSSGSAEELKRELQRIREELEAAERSEDPAERARRRADAERALRELTQFARRKLGSDPLGEALARALEQLRQLDQMPGAPMEGLEALRETLELGEIEMDRLAQSLRDMQKLEEALRACEKAAAANDEKALDGGECQGCKSLAEYEALYERLLARGGGGFGPGQQSPGTGEGNAAAEDESQKTAFQPEKSPAELTAGRLLLEMDDRGVGETGERTEEFRQQVEVLRNRASEAIRSEEVPPGYHDPIRRYFDALRSRGK